MQTLQYIAGDFVIDYLKCKFQLNRISRKNLDGHGKTADDLLACLEKRAKIFFNQIPLLAALYMDPRFNDKHDEINLTPEMKNQVVVSNLFFLC